MKIGIISNDDWLRQWDNYGTLFQNYALQTHLRHLGHETFWILTRNERLTARDALKKALLRTARDPSFPLRVAKALFVSQILFRRERARIAAFNAKHPRRFAEFFEKYVPHTRGRFSCADLTKNPPPADAYIVGSDQVWGCVSVSTFLGFGAPDALRIAYAASTAWKTKSEAWLDAARRAFPRFDAVSVRERDGIDVCERAGRRDAVHVADPTLLLEKEDYMRIVREEGKGAAFPKKTVLAYFLNVKKLESLPWHDLVEFARERAAALKVVPLQGAELAIPEEFVFAPSPSEWLNAYDKADCVLTNSFHGTAFAIIMRKPFLVVLQKGKTAGENCRFLSLLEKLNLESRIFDEMGGGEASRQKWMRRSIGRRSKRSSMPFERNPRSSFRARSRCGKRDRVPARERFARHSRISFWKSSSDGKSGGLFRA